MRPVLASVVDWEALLQVLWVSFAAGLGVTLVFALGIVGAARAVDLRRDGHAVESVIWAALAVIAGLAVAASVVFAFVVMTDK